MCSNHWSLMRLLLELSFAWNNVLWFFNLQLVIYVCFAALRWFVSIVVVLNTFNGKRPVSFHRVILLLFGPISSKYSRFCIHRDRCTGRSLNLQLKYISPARWGVYCEFKALPARPSRCIQYRVIIDHGMTIPCCILWSYTWFVLNILI